MCIRDRYREEKRKFSNKLTQLPDKKKSVTIIKMDPLSSILEKKGS